MPRLRGRDGGWFELGVELQIGGLVHVGDLRALAVKLFHRELAENGFLRSFRAEKKQVQRIFSKMKRNNLVLKKEFIS